MSDDGDGGCGPPGTEPLHIYIAGHTSPSPNEMRGASFSPVAELTDEEAAAELQRLEVISCSLADCTLEAWSFLLNF